MRNKEKKKDGGQRLNEDRLFLWVEGWGGGGGCLVLVQGHSIRRQPNTSTTTPR